MKKKTRSHFLFLYSQLSHAFAATIIFSSLFKPQFIYFFFIRIHHSTFIYPLLTTHYSPFFLSFFLFIHISVFYLSCLVRQWHATLRSLVRPAISPPPSPPLPLSVSRRPRTHSHIRTSTQVRTWTQTHTEMQTEMKLGRERGVAVWTRILPYLGTYPHRPPLYNTVQK